MPQAQSHPTLFTPSPLLSLFCPLSLSLPPSFSLSVFKVKPAPPLIIRKSCVCVFVCVWCDNKDSFSMLVDITNLVAMQDLVWVLLLLLLLLLPLILAQPLAVTARKKWGLWLLTKNLYESCLFSPVLCKSSMQRITYYLLCIKDIHSICVIILL